MKTGPLVLEIKGNSLDDGPGIRSVVFFKGCPLDCSWCHNPESKNRSVEISFDAGKCIGCDSCLTVCSPGALSRKNKYFIDRSRCTLCFVCVESCPSGALERVGTAMPTVEIVNAVIKDKPFFDTSGGGVTLTGGEPTIDIDYTSRLLKDLKKNGIRVLIETCGFFNFDRFSTLIAPYIDMIYYDIKLIDDKDHQKFCGVSNELILSNFTRLYQKYLEGGIEILPRTPLIPGVTDTEKNITAIADLYRAHGVTRAALLSYNPLWHEKNLKLGIGSLSGKKGKAAQWMPREKEEYCRSIYKKAGIEIV